MKATGVIRPIDELGRIVIPKELRKRFDIKEGQDSLEIYVESDMIILKKYEPTCIFCGGEDDIVDFRDKCVCKSCITKLSQK